LRRRPRPNWAVEPRKEEEEEEEDLKGRDNLEIIDAGGKMVS
jgi:hypothetical protein